MAMTSYTSQFDDISTLAIYDFITVACNAQLKGVIKTALPSHQSTCPHSVSCSSLLCKRMASSRVFRLLLIFFSAIVLLFLVTSIELSFSQYRKWIPRIEALEMSNPQTTGPKTFSREDVETLQNLLKGMGLGKQTVNSEEELMANLPDNTQLDNEQTHSLAEKDTNLAILYWDEWFNYTVAGSHQNEKVGATYCKGVQLTSPFDVRQVNRYWQRFDASPTNKKEETIFMYLLNAYYDKRIDADGRPTVRLLTVNKQEPVSSKRKWW